MKSDVMPSIVQMDPEVLKSLVREVKETVAKDVNGIRANQPSFGIADLWNVRRKARYCKDFLGR